ncbi:MAG: dihydroorotate dehydrogenase (quinone) [Halobacteriovoraceae bacterium]|nr:dihydroorotate dehydrogenase (quinone) [Halobacteriovoraceae bacterium]|tara:strand:+ start:9719 stop:10765 length:1047 start_codon:yes stop_codon:yes gene_type:complete
MDFYSAFKHVAFKLDAEQVHDLTINLLSKAPWLSELFNPTPFNPKLKLTTPIMSWPHPIGLAAGFDKNAKCIKFFENIGFGSLELGTITKEPQSGNPKPRIFRHSDQYSLRNAMGFPNDGSLKIFKRIERYSKSQMVIGSNIGKNKNTPPEMTANEYADLYQLFAPLSDYLVVNVSSPNTPGLRDFQKVEQLKPILETVIEKRRLHPKPLFVKISPDMNQEDIKLLCELVKELNIDGVIATNTTIQHSLGVGGVSGRLIRPHAFKTREWTCEYLREDPSKIIIGVGGIEGYEDLKTFWKQGGSFAQIYTSFIYQGPQIIKKISHDILDDIEHHQLQNINELRQYYREL